MNQLQTIDEHILIRETVGYNVISQIEVFDLPNVMQFLKICDNYLKMQRIREEINE